MSPLGLSLLLAVSIAALHIVSSKNPSWDNESCSRNETSKSQKISLRSRRNASGNWVTKFAVYGNNADIPEGVDLDVKQTVTKCDGKERILLEGILGLATDDDINVEIPNAKLITSKTHFQKPETPKSECNCDETPRRNTIAFHPRKGNNITLSNNGRTAARNNPLDNYRDGIVLTNRALNDEELFEVRIDEVVGKWAGSLEFGVTKKSPEEIEIYSDQFQYNYLDNWFFGKQEFKIERMDIPHGYVYKAGEWFGVKKTKDGELFFYLNGQHVGSVKTNTDQKMYGIIDVYGQATKATILSPP